MTDHTDLISELEAQHERLQFSRFSVDDAWALGSLLVRLGRERSLGITIDIRRGDQQLFHAALAGTTADNDDWVMRKVRTVRRFGEASYLVGRRQAAKGADFNEKFGLPLSEFAAHGGASRSSCATAERSERSPSRGCPRPTTTRSWSRR